MDRAELEQLDRESLVSRAQAAGIRRARLLTRPELIDELLRLDPAVDRAHLKKNRGFFGIARDLLSKVVERGLHLPDAADRLRAALGSSLPQVPRPEPQAVPTVTLAEIYAAQGHKVRAIETLRRVLETEPEHNAARALLEKLEAADYVAPPRPLPPEMEEPGDEIGGRLGTDGSREPSEANEASGTDEVKEELAPVQVAEVELPAPSPLATSAAPAAVDEVGVETPIPSDQAVTLPKEPSQSECVAIPLGGGRSYVWWQLSSPARRIAEEAFFFVRAVVLVPTWDGPRRETRDVACDPAAGELIVENLPEGAVVRIAIGVMEGGEVVPLAHSPALERTEHEQRLVEWTLDGVVPVPLEDPKAATIARAVEASRRSTRRHRD